MYKNIKLLKGIKNYSLQFYKENIEIFGNVN